MSDSLSPIESASQIGRGDETMEDFVIRTLRDFGEVANMGYSVALQIGFSQPTYWWLTLPPASMRYYEEQNLILTDPAIRWTRQNGGWIDWRDLRSSDDDGFFEEAKAFGLDYGVAVSIPCDTRSSTSTDPRRSYGSFTRNDRPFTPDEARRLHDQMAALHFETCPMQPLSRSTRDFLHALTQSMVAGLGRVGDLPR